MEFVIVETYGGNSKREDRKELMDLTEFEGL